MPPRVKKQSENSEELAIVDHLDLSLAKEYSIYSDAHVGRPTLVDDMINQAQRLQLNTYQAFVRNLFNPLSEHKSLLLIHGTGTGKTITSLSVAIEYQKQYREFMVRDKGQLYDDIHSIMVVGYTKDIFKDELISHTEFGFVSSAELAELKELQQNAHQSHAIVEKLQNLKVKLYRRISDRRMLGIFQFYGYRQLFNRAINGDDLNKMLAKHRNLASVDTDTINQMDVAQIRSWVRDGSIRLNRSFIESLKHSLIICDEIHNAYYQGDVNGYGLVLEIIKDYFDEPKLYNSQWTVANEYCLRWLFLSATPIATSPTEIIPVINLLNSKSNRVSHSDIFDSESKEITNRGLSLIGRRVSGHISYIMDDNPIHYPAALFMGEDIPNIPYIKFIRCPMSKLHQDIYDQYLISLRTVNEDSEGTNRGSTLKDFAFLSAQKDILLSKYIDVQQEIKSGTSPYKESAPGILVSDSFTVDKLGVCSEKYANIVKHILNLRAPEHGKIFVYHPYVQTTGTNLLTSIFKANGLLELDDVPQADSICMTCAHMYKDHNCKKSNCEFVPVRFAVVTGYISKQAANSRLRQYNSQENSDGRLIKILLGSKAMREGHTLKACRHLMVAHQPASISELIQIIGRGVRKQSHALLPPDARNIRLYIFVSSLHASNELSSEESNYFEKMRLYKQILTIEQVLFKQSLDYLINFRFKQREVPKLIGESFPLDMPLYDQYRTMKAYPVSRMGSLRSNTFFYMQEVDICTYIIKRILVEFQPAIFKSDLTKMIHDPPFAVEADPTMISDEIIEYVLDNLCYYQHTGLVIDHTNKVSDLVESLYSHTKTVVGLDNQSFYIKYSKMADKDLIYLDPVAAATNDLHKLITRNSPNLPDQSIDLETLSNQWNELVHIDDIMADLYAEYHKNNSIDGSIAKRMSQFTLEIHIKLIEYCILNIALHIFVSHGSWKSIYGSLIIDLIEYYSNRNLIITIRDTIGTIVEPFYKKYTAMTGASWTDAIHAKVLPKRINYSYVPIGHYAKYIPKLLSIESIVSTPPRKDVVPVWNEYSTIVQSKSWTYPYKLFGYEERGNNIESTFKIRDLTDRSSKGITPIFMQQKDLIELAKRMKIKVDASERKIEISERIRKFIIDTETKYRSANGTNKIFYYAYETIQPTTHTKI